MLEDMLLFDVTACDIDPLIIVFFFFLLLLPLDQVKIWFQNHRYKCKRQAKEKAMAEQNQHNQVK